MGLPREWLQERFFNGFFATIFLEGQKSVSTHGEDHQRRFARVARRLREIQRVRQVTEMPTFFAKSGITGHYQDYDDALINLQNGLLSAQNPYYVRVNINCSESLANDILSEYSPEQRDLLKQLVDEYLAESETA